MENVQPKHEKQWWAPVWKGLVVDADAKHYRRMKNAVWLYLYLVITANRVTGVLMRKTRTISTDMGIPRDMVIRWLNVLRQEGYIATLSTGRYLTIQVKNWKPLASRGRIPPQMLGISDTRCWKYPTPSRPHGPPIPDYSGPKSGVFPPPKKKKINKSLNNETQSMQHATMHGPDDGAFKAIGSYAHQELLAWDLARVLDDPDGIALYRSYCQRYPEELLRKVLGEVKQVPATGQAKKGRIEIFNHLLKHYAQGTTENLGG